MLLNPVRVSSPKSFSFASTLLTLRNAIQHAEHEKPLLEEHMKATKMIDYLSLVIDFCQGQNNKHPDGVTGGDIFPLVIGLEEGSSLEELIQALEKRQSIIRDFMNSGEVSPLLVKWVADLDDMLHGNRKDHDPADLTAWWTVSLYWAAPSPLAPQL